MATGIQKTYYSNIAKIYNKIVVPAEHAVAGATKAAAAYMEKSANPKPVENNFFIRNTNLFQITAGIETLKEFTSVPVKLADSITVSQENITPFENANKAIINNLREHLNYLGTVTNVNVVQSYTEVLATFYLLRVYFVTLINILANKVSSAVSTGQTQDAEIKALRDQLVLLRDKSTDEKLSLQQQIDSLSGQGLTKDAIISRLQDENQITAEQAKQLRGQLNAAQARLANAEARGQSVEAALVVLQTDIKAVKNTCQGTLCPAIVNSGDHNLEIIKAHIEEQKQTIDNLKELIRVAAPLLASFNM